jgi:hypothetical protein
LCHETKENMANFSTTYAVDNNAEVNVVCHVDGVSRIVVQENYDSATPPTADLIQRCAVPGSGQVKIPKGTPAIYTTATSFRKGEIAGTIETSSGSITVQQVESSQV